MKWSANLPDLNAIENLWTRLKVKFHQEWEAHGNERMSRDFRALAKYTEMIKRIWKRNFMKWL